jgi:RNA polymerase sigma-70 factor (ECF subfamily)
MSVDLELAQRATAGDASALQAVDALVSTLPVSDEARQVVRHRVLVDGRLREFAGKGSLRSWLKAVALRVEVDLRRANREDAMEDSVLDQLVPPSAHAEKSLVDAEARAVLRSALHEALKALPERERLYVQHYHLDGLTLTRIGMLYGVAPSTVMRTLARTMEQLRDLVREHLVATHHLGLASLESLVRAGAA